MEKYQIWRGSTDTIFPKVFPLRLTALASKLRVPNCIIRPNTQIIYPTKTDIKCINFCILECSAHFFFPQKTVNYTETNRQKKNTQKLRYFLI